VEYDIVLDLITAADGFQDDQRMIEAAQETLVVDDRDPHEPATLSRSGDGPLFGTSFKLTYSAYYRNIPMSRHFQTVV
jgi:hypothetical protein